MLPSAVLTQRKAGARAPRAPEPVLMTVCRHPALVTAAKQGRPSLTTSQVGSRLRLAKPSTARLQKLVTPAQLQPHRLSLRRGLDRRQEGRLTGRTAATLAARAALL